MAISTGIGDAWIPFALVRRIERRGRWIVIVHDCQEVRSPIELSLGFAAIERDNAVYRFLEESMRPGAARPTAPAALPACQPDPFAHHWKGMLFRVARILYRAVRVAFALGLAGFGVYLSRLEYRRGRFFEASFLAVFAGLCVVIAGLTILWGIPGHEWRRKGDQSEHD